MASFLTPVHIWMNIESVKTASMWNERTEVLCRKYSTIWDINTPLDLLDWGKSGGWIDGLKFSENLHDNLNQTGYVLKLLEIARSHITRDRYFKITLPKYM